MRRLLAACLVLVPVLFSSAAPAVSTTVLISEFRARGPNGATDEFIELFNASATTAVTLTGYELMVSDGAGGTKPLAQITTPTILQPKHFYLLVNSLGYSGATAANATYTANIPDSGGIALFNASNTVVDQVGMSVGSAYKEGTNLDPLFGNVNQSYERNNGNCAATKDTDDNAADFRLNATTSAPQNNAFDCNSCLGVTCTIPPNTQCWQSPVKCAAGSCNYPQRATGFACSDGDACTLNDKCDASGVCVSGAAATCTTPPAPTCSDPQTLMTSTGPGTCDLVTGCAYTKTSTHCAFGCNGVTKACNPDPCSSVSCVTPPANGCYDSPGLCTNGTCVYAPKPRNTTCTDGNACTVGDLCDANGTCLAGADKRDDGNPCTVDACNTTTGVVTHTNGVDGTNCDDGNPCNGTETCQTGTCTAGPPVACVTPPPGGCYASSGICNLANGSCSYALLGQATSCDDKNPCTTLDQCDGNGVCGGSSVVCTPPAPTCGDANTQRTYSGGACQAGSCAFTQTDKPCASGCDAVSGLCKADPCIGVVCAAPPDACHAAGVCSGGTCTFAVTSGKSCDDGDPCTGADQCSAGGACAGTPLLCNTPPLPTCVGNASHQFVVTGSCSAGACAYAPVVPDAVCSSGCDSSTGLCKADPCATVTCDAPPDQCHQSNGTCANGACSYALKADGANCDDVNACTEQDTCMGGVCSGTPIACNTPTAPTCVDANTSRHYQAAGTCDSLGHCGYAAVTPDTVCATGCNAASGLCNGDPCASKVCASPPASCYLGTGTCLAGGVCDYVPLSAGVTCDDSNPCTTSDACDGTGRCVGTAIASCSADAGMSVGPDASTSTGGAKGTGGAGGAANSPGGASSAGGTATSVGGIAASAGGTATGTAGTATGTGGSGGAAIFSVDGGIGGPDAGPIPKSGDTGGCGCSVPTQTKHTPWSLAVAAAAVFAARRRKNRGSLLR